MKDLIFKAKDPMSALTHFIGFLAVIPCFFILMQKASLINESGYTLGFLTFGISLLLLYGASTIYHTLNVSFEKSELLRRIDHICIFILIAGSYTPICLTALRGTYGNIMLLLIWGLTACGTALKIFWWSAPRWLYTLIYVGMGWLAVVVIKPLKEAVGMGGMGMLLAGGIAYTIGALIYVLKKPNIGLKHFGFHEIFHVFVMLGSGIHILFMLWFL